MDKKNKLTVENSLEVLELDELYWSIKQKQRTQTKENVYLTTMVSRNPRQIVGFDVAYDRSNQRIQAIVASAPRAAKYCTDGYLGYTDVAYPGKRVRNVSNKNDTYTVEDVNADLRHYIPILARRRRCFARSLDTMRAVLEVFVDAYNKFGEEKRQFRKHRATGEVLFSILCLL